MRSRRTCALKDTAPGLKDPTDDQGGCLEGTAHGGRTSGSPRWLVAGGRPDVREPPPLEPSSVQSLHSSRPSLGLPSRDECPQMWLWVWTVGAAGRGHPAEASVWRLEMFQALASSGGERDRPGLVSLVTVLGKETTAHSGVCCKRGGFKDFKPFCISKIQFPPGPFF